MTEDVFCWPDLTVDRQTDGGSRQEKEEAADNASRPSPPFVDETQRSWQPVSPHSPWQNHN